jgi:putative PIN family toxin of toxin-antitoxin system
MRIVLDTNVLLSGLMLPTSGPGQIINAWRLAQFDLVLSQPMLNEIARVLTYPKIRKRLCWDDKAIQRFILLLRFKAEIVDISLTKINVPADPADNPILATLIAAHAEYLITGDQDLLVLRQNYPILTPTEFAKKLWP